MPLALFALALGAFGIGTTEFIIAGLLPDLAADFGTSIPTAGLLVSGYAMGVVVGAPLVTAAGARLPRKTMLVGLMVLFIAAHVLSALAPSYGALMTGRIVASFAHGAYIGIGSVVAADLVRPERRASAIALMFMGLSLSNVLGVPFGTFLGQNFGWRVAFWTVAVIGVAALAGIVALVPAGARPTTGLRHELAAFRRGQVWLALAMTALGWAPLLAVVTYVAPLLTEVAGYSADAVPFVMVLLGLGMLVGGPIGGRYADRALMPTLYALLAAITVVAVVLLLAAGDQVAVVVVLTLYGIVASAVIPPLQSRVLEQAVAAQALASAANVAAFNLGNAMGPFLAGLAISAGFGYTSPMWVAALLGVSGLAVALLSGVLDRRRPAAEPEHTAACVAAS
ncbi:DHA1 family inner membrane transport protein [Thermocatellispora tengchongensis]|uniref:DHA1 family inner membrane transport protein n=1 Tax=Thermocatellispora tengchongensis TaxID=1073253 RepID=A0A840P4C1_9ACTN|nr:MFS transporter [Thermocatellispora tengchongensis]MBB5132753.1 DHA1 family inner membrane transport protein [Thermocatellispora tengchongensis]